MFSFSNVQKNVERGLYQHKSGMMRLIFTFLLLSGVLAYSSEKVPKFWGGMGNIIISFLVFQCVLAFDYGVRAAIKMMIEEKIEIRFYDFMTLGLEKIGTLIVKNSILLVIWLIIYQLSSLFFRKHFVRRINHKCIVIHCYTENIFGRLYYYG